MSRASARGATARGVVDCCNLRLKAMTTLGREQAAATPHARQAEASDLCVVPQWPPDADSLGRLWAVTARRRSGVSRAVLTQKRTSQRVLVAARSPVEHAHRNVGDDHVQARAVRQHRVDEG